MSRNAWLRAALVLVTIPAVGGLMVRAQGARVRAEERAVARSMGEQMLAAAGERLRDLQVLSAELATDVVAQDISVVSAEHADDDYGPGIHRAVFDADWNVVAKCPRMTLDRLSATGFDEESGPLLVGPLEIADGARYVMAASSLRASEQGRWASTFAPVEELLPTSLLETVRTAGFAYELSAREAGGGRAPVPLDRTTAAILDDPGTVASTVASVGLEVSIAPHDGWREPVVRWRHVGFLLMLTAVLASLAMERQRSVEELDEELETTRAELKDVKRKVLEEVERRLHIEQEMSFHALHDPVTHLPNRRGFLHRLGVDLERLRRGQGEHIGVMIVALDRFDRVEQSLGAGAADELRLEASQRIEGCLQPGDLVASLDADTIGILISDAADPSGAGGVVDPLRETLAEPFSVRGHEIYLTASIGLAAGESILERPQDLYRRAEVALVRAQAAGGDQVEIFDPESAAEAGDELQLDSDLRRALERDEFFLNFQPIVDLETMSLRGLEALIRWEHPLDGLLAPYRFILRAEETGFIVQISDWLLGAVSRCIADWKPLLEKNDVYISINLSGRDFGREDLCERVAHVYEGPGADPRVIKLEVTEGIIMRDHSAVSRNIELLRDLGVPLMLDDFGTGYSSLSYLERFSFDTLKIDRSFVAGSQESAKQAAIVRTIVALARDLGMHTVAEGIETREIASRMLETGCDYGQGYLFARPLGVEAIGKILEEGRVELDD